MSDIQNRWNWDGDGFRRTVDGRREFLEVGDAAMELEDLEARLAEAVAANTARVKADYDAGHVRIDINDWVPLQEELRAARERAEAAEAACAAMRERVEALAHVGSTDKARAWCLWCGGHRGIHADDCIVAAALASDAGKTLLAQVAAMRVSITELVAAMRDYQMDVDDSPPGFHRAMMNRAEAALACNASAALLARLERLSTIEALAQDWRKAWSEAEAFRAQTHTWGEEACDRNDSLWQIETEKALALQAALEAPHD